jgi:hypothetical protein
LGPAGQGIVPVGAERENLLAWRSITHQGSQPSFKPRLRGNRPWRIILAVLVVQSGNHSWKVLQVKSSQIITNRIAQPKLAIVPM